MRDYRSSHLVKYEPPPQRGYCSLKVLHQLVGRGWDERALGFVHALRPSCIRVTNGAETCDSYPWRVTVRVTEMGTIREIVQEVEIGLTGTPFEHGHDAITWLQGECGK